MYATKCHHHAPARWNDFFGDFNSDVEPRPVSPRVNAYGTESALHIDLEVPGVAKEDVSVSIENNVLSIKAKRAKNDDKNREWYRSEISTGDYERTFRISHGYNTESVEAKIDNGILRLSIQKNEEAKPKEIQIN